MIHIKCPGCGETGKGYLPKHIQCPACAEVTKQVLEDEKAR